MKKKLVVMAGPGLGTPGGMTTVIEACLSGALAGSVEIRYLPCYLASGWRTQCRVMGRAIATLLGLLLTRRVAVLHVHSASRGSFWRKSSLVLLARLFRVPVAFHLHSGEFPAFYHRSHPLARALIRSVLRSAGEVVCLSRTWFDVLSGIEPAAALTVIGNPVEVPERLARKSGPVRTVLFLGRLRAIKGVFDLLDAMPRILQCYPDLRFVLAGDEDETAVRRHAEALGVAHAAVVPGWVAGERKRQLLAEADLFVLPSHFEALPVSILEAMAAGVPVVATRVGGIPDLIDDGVHGLLVEKQRPDRLAEAICRLCGDEALRAALAEAADARVRGTYAPAQVFTQLGALYRRLGYPPQPQPPLEAAPADAS